MVEYMVFRYFSAFKSIFMFSGAFPLQNRGKSQNDQVKRIHQIWAAGEMQIWMHFVHIIDFIQSKDNKNGEIGGHLRNSFDFIAPTNNQLLQ